MSQNLEQLLQTVKNPVDLLRNSKIGAYVYPVVPSEFTNWRDEQKAWRDSAVLFDQSHHMAELLVTGPDASKMLNYLASNSFKGFVPEQGEAVRAPELRRLRDRRRDHVLPRRKTSSISWAARRR